MQEPFRIQHSTFNIQHSSIRCGDDHKPPPISPVTISHVAVLPNQTMLGPYRIAGLIGEGGMGAVYRAQDTRLGRDVAIKVLSNVTSFDREKLLRFEQEARTAGMLNHPNLVTIYDVGNAGEVPYVVSELLDGESLRDRLNRGPIAPRRAAEIAMGIAQGLAAAHEKGIVHRDLKPENIFGTRDGRFKILDFGIAKLSATASGEAFKMKFSTEPGFVLGTVGYMSPEQVRGEEVDQRSDIFAFGAILFEMLTGERAFKRNTAVETLTAILKEEPAELTDIVPNIPPQFTRLVHRCLEKDRNQRFQSARDLAFNLEVLLTLPAGQNTMTGTGTRRPAPAAAQATPTTAQMLQEDGTMRKRPPHPTIGRVPPPQTRPQTVVKPKRTVSPRLIAALFIVSILGAAFGGWKLANRVGPTVENTSYKRLTFQRGEIRSARFTPDGETVVYSAAWNGAPADIFVGSRHSPESRALGVREAEVLAVSRSAEAALLVRRDRLTGIGTLARIPIAGGAPREILNGVLDADFSPDGSQLAIIRTSARGFRVEYPIGTAKYETGHFIRDLRVSPDGAQVAFIEPHGGANDIVVVGDDGPEPVARGWSSGAKGLVWSPDGDEIWITGTDSAAPPALWAVSMNGDIRLVSRLTGAMQVFDISNAGRILVGHGTWRAALHYLAPGESEERDVSWFDWSIASDLSRDGRTLLFNEMREGGGARNAVYLRRAGSDTPMRIGEGYGDALSPDGEKVLSHVGGKLVVLPTGPGEQREVNVKGSFELGAVWLPDSRRAVIAGADPSGSYRLWLLDTNSDDLTPLTPERIWGAAVRPFAVSPDGREVAGMTRDEMIAIYPMDGTQRARAIRGVHKGEIPIQWSADGRYLYVYRPTVLPSSVVRVDLVDGSRHDWREFAPADRAGIYRIAPVLITPAGHAYAYNALRTLDDLYVVEGVR